jgi:hypothetical protein
VGKGAQRRAHVGVNEDCESFFLACLAALELDGVALEEI